MSAAASHTLSSTGVDTDTDVASVTRKLRADLVQVLDHYGYFSWDYGEDTIHDLRLMIYHGIIDSVEFTWRAYGSDIVLAAFRYDILLGDNGLADNRPGGIPYRFDLKFVRFDVIVRYNAAGQALSSTDKQNLGLKLCWGPVGGLDYSTGSWSNDRSYVSNGIGLQRSVFY